MERTNQKAVRVWTTVLYLVALFLIQWLFIDRNLLPDEHEVWLLSGICGLVFGSQLLTPHWTPPSAAGTNAFFAGFAMLPALSVETITAPDRVILLATFAAASAVFLGSLVAILLEASARFSERRFVRWVTRAVSGLGSPVLIFTVIIVVSAWVFHRTEPAQMFVILTTWTVIVAIKPLETLFGFFSWASRIPAPLAGDVIGHIAAHQTPGLSLIRQQNEVRYRPGTLMLLSDDQGPVRLGVAVNYVGRDDGLLLRALSLPLPLAVAKPLLTTILKKGAAHLLSLDKTARENIKLLDRVDSLRGIVDSDTNLDFLNFEVVNDESLSEGRLVDVQIGERRVIYQIINGVTHEESVQQKNKYGYARATARKIGIWDTAHQKFTKVPWLPRINSPVFVLDPVESSVRPEAVGHFPQTNFSVSVNISELVTHNTAILGILGIGKSYLAVELVERMIAEGIKVICLDLTDQYAALLADHLNMDRQTSWNNDLDAAGSGRPAAKSKTEGGSYVPFYAALKAQLTEFLDPASAESIRLVNPAQFRVSRQTGGWNAESAGFVDLTPSEITSLFSSAALAVCQQMGMSPVARACIVYEEAHTLVPEWNSVANENDKVATAASARAILQGRKFGLGCLLITQRTANVTKTILNQCNTLFAMRTFDDTGKEFLSNYIGAEYARVLPSLQERHAVLFGKASCCDDPVLIRLNDREAFLEAFYPDQADKLPAVGLSAEAANGDGGETGVPSQDVE